MKLLTYVSEIFRAKREASSIGNRDIVTEARIDGAAGCHLSLASLADNNGRLTSRHRS